MCGTYQFISACVIIAQYYSFATSLVMMRM